MNRSDFRCTAAALFGVALCTVAAARAEYKCETPRSLLDQRACEAAKQSPQALRWFIQRMRAIENLYFPDYLKEEQRVAGLHDQESARARRAAAQSTDATTAR
jgi:hypothetical protein